MEPIKRSITIFSFGIFALFITATLLHNPLVWVDTLFDDAYYYLGIARNISLGNGSMFAPPLSTNGYQPLWLWILSAASYVLDADHAKLAAFTHFLSATFAAAFFYIARKQDGAAWPAALATLAFPLVSYMGMETAMLPFFGLMFLRTNGWKSGVFASLLFLTRLDALGLIAGKFIYEFVAQKKIDWRTFLITTTVVSIYFAANKIIFDTPVPISGIAKTIGMEVGENWPAIKEFTSRSIPIIISYLIILVIKKSKFGLKNPKETISTSISILISSIYYGTFSGWGIWHWYTWPICIMFYLTILDIKNAKSNLINISTSICLSKLTLSGLIPLSVTALTVRDDMKGNINDQYTWGQNNYAYAQTLISPHFQGATIAMGDRAGSLGFFLPPTIKLIQTEGLVANIPYLEALKSENGVNFLQQHNVDYLIIDRNKFWTLKDMYIVPEPVQGLSSKYGIMLMCLPKSAEIIDPELKHHNRKIFKFRERVDCPSQAIEHFEKRKAKYGAMNKSNVP